MATVAKKRPTPGKRRPAAPNPWPARLYALRQFYDRITQAEAAARIAAPTKTWENWEQGRRLPSPMIIRLLELTFPEYFAQS
jgi:DNA-binding transcriptional regulator YiaG